MRRYPQSLVGEALKGLCLNILPPLAVDAERAHEAHALTFCLHAPCSQER